MNPRMWADLKYKLVNAQANYEQWRDSTVATSEAMAWGGKASMALEALLMMEYLEKGNSGQGRFVDDVVVGDVGGPGLSSTAHDVP